MDWTKFFYKKSGNTLIPKSMENVIKQVIKHEYHLTGKGIPTNHMEKWFQKLTGEKFDWNIFKKK